MQKFINPEELKTVLAEGDGPVLFVLLDRRIDSSNLQQILAELFTRFDGRLKILLLDIAYQNVVIERFKVHGFPAFIFCEQGKRKNVLLGAPDPATLREFVVNNLSGKSLS